MISEEDKAYVIRELTKQLATLDKPRQTLTASFFGTSFPEKLGAGLAGQLATEAVHLALVDRWDHDPPWLSLLLELVPEDEKIAAILEQLRHPPPAPPDPLETTIISPGMPFIGRAWLRQRLRFLESTPANLQPILVVNGASKIGKTYSRYYIEHFSHHRPLIVPYPLEFDPDQGLELEPQYLASDLVLQMGRSADTMPPPDTNQKLYVQRLALWVLNEAVKTSKTTWFILDNFQGDKLRPDTRDFLVALSDRITTGIFSQSCRLILIGFDRAQLTVEPGKLEEDFIQPCTPAEIEAALAEILKRAPVALDVDQILQLVLEGLPNDHEKMAELNMRLRTLLYAIPEVALILKNVPGADYEEVLRTVLANLPNGVGRLTELKNRLQALRVSAVEVKDG